MAGSVSSGKKADGFIEVSIVSKSFMEELKEGIRKIIEAGDVIALPAVDGLTQGIAGLDRTAIKLYGEVVPAMNKMLSEWKERKEYQSAAYIAKFEEAEKEVASLSGIEPTVFNLEEHTGLDENVSDETVKAFNTAIINMLDIKNRYIKQVANIYDEYSTSDTANIYESLGSGLESFTNGIGVLLDNHREALKAVGVSIDDVTASIQSQSATLADFGAQARQQMEAESALD